MPSQQRLVLGMGAGQCGLNLLAEILGQQPSSRVTLEQRPLLPWVQPAGRPGIRQRFDRWTSQHQERIVGDIATFYLPYVEEAIGLRPDLRVVCLKRPSDEIVAGYCRQIDQQFSIPTNHWSVDPGPEWTSDPQWSATFPQYDTTDRVTAVRRYCQEYYDRADELARRFPDNVLVIDTEVLTNREGVHSVLDFVGVPRELQTIVTGRKPSPPKIDTILSSRPARKYPNPMDPRRCVVLVPYSGSVYPECDESLKELERRGYQVRRIGGYAAIDQGRNQMSTDALIDGFEETLWIDSDVAFHPDDVEKLRRHGLPMVCGIYPQKGKRALACHVALNTPKVVFGQQGGLIEMLYAGTGFLHIRREVYLAVQRKLQLPMCNERFGHPMIPFFHPMVHQIDDGHWYLAEDYAFCERARQSGFQIFADTSIRLWHIGMYRYGWEDAGIDRPRFNSFTLNFGEPPADSKSKHPNQKNELAQFAARFPWPTQPPQVPPIPERDWLFPATKRLLTESVSRDAELIVEVGSWMGRSTRLLAGLAPHAKVIAIDHWRGSPEHADDPELVAFMPHLFEAFLKESWEFREQIVPVRASSVDGLNTVSEAGLQPDMIYIDADHSYEGVLADVTTALDRFPGVRIVGDDWNWPGVKRAVEQLVALRRLKLEVFETAWRIMG